MAPGVRHERADGVAARALAALARAWMGESFTPPPPTLPCSSPPPEIGRRLSFGADFPDPPLK